MITNLLFLLSMTSAPPLLNLGEGEKSGDAQKQQIAELLTASIIFGLKNNFNRQNEVNNGYQKWHSTSRYFDGYR